MRDANKTTTKESYADRGKVKRRVALLTMLLITITIAAHAGVEFDGTDDMIDCDDISDIDGASNLTVSVWIKLNDLTKDSDVCAKGTHDTGSPMLFWRDTTVGGGSQAGNTNCLSALIYDGYDNAWASSPSDSLNDMRWHHVAFSFVAKTSGGLRVYVDGVGANSADTLLVDYIANSALLFTIGSPTAGVPVNHFSGVMTELAAWNAVLTEQEINLLANAKTKHLCLQIRPENLIVYLPFDDISDGQSGDGRLFKDLSGNGNNGTGSDGDNDSGLIGQAEEVLSYPVD